MRLILKRNNSEIDAAAEYDEATGSVTVLAGSKVSKTINYTEKFRGAKSIEKARFGVIDNNRLVRDVSFKSASTAANFVTGSSTNGLTAWKTVDGISLKEYKKGK